MRKTVPTTGQIWAKVTPMVALDLSHAKAKRYTESGADALNLQVNAQTPQEVILKVGAQVQQQITAKTQWTSSAALGYDLRNQKNAVTARFTCGGVAYKRKASRHPEPWPSWAWAFCTKPATPCNWAPDTTCA